HDVRRERDGERDGLLAVGRLPDDLDLPLLVQHHAQRGARIAGVVAEQQADHCVAASSAAESAASTSASEPSSFVRNACAPAPRALRRSAVDWEEVTTTTTLADGSSRPRFRVASIPSMTGISMSISTTSGRRESASSTASRPSEARPTTSSLSSWL